MQLAFQLISFGHFANHLEEPKKVCVYQQLITLALIYYLRWKLHSKHAAKCSIVFKLWHPAIVFIRETLHVIFINIAYFHTEDK